MAHKTLIDGTAYTVSGGRTLVDGTSYSVKNGKVLVDGTEYDISFVLSPAVLDLWIGSNSNYNRINCIMYANGYWVVGGVYFYSDDNDNTRYARIAYTTDLTGAWTTKDVWSDSTRCAVNCIAYANGYWVAGGEAYSYGRIAYTTNPSGTWTVKDVWYGSSPSDILCIIYANDCWVVGGRYRGDPYNARIAYSPTIDGFDEI